MSAFRRAAVIGGLALAAVVACGSFTGDPGDGGAETTATSSGTVQGATGGEAGTSGASSGTSGTSGSTASSSSSSGSPEDCPPCPISPHFLCDDFERSAVLPFHGWSYAGSLPEGDATFRIIALDAMSCRRALQVHVENLGGGVSETRVMKTTFTRPLNGNVDVDLDFSFVANESEFSSPARAAFLGLTPDGDDLEGKTFIALIVEKDGVYMTGRNSVVAPLLSGKIPLASGQAPVHLVWHLSTTGGPSTLTVSGGPPIKEAFPVFDVTTKYSFFVGVASSDDVGAAGVTATFDNVVIH